MTFAEVAHCREASAAEHRAASLAAQLTTACSDALTAQEARDEATTALTALQEEHAALKEEYSAVADDLTIMARENEVEALPSLALLSWSLKQRCIALTKPPDGVTFTAC